VRRARPAGGRQPSDADATTDGSPTGAPPAVAPLDVALRFLATRPRSEAEVRRRLARAQLPAEIIDTTVRQLRRLGLVDDEAFAAYWVDQRRAFRPRGARLLRAELRAHGVAADLAAASAAAETDEIEDAYRAAVKKARQLATADEPTFRTRLTQFLARRGFGWDTIGSTVERCWRERA
jgi:regulatory protein